ncbi:MAG: adenylate/guanylate cyclase domain-containing protein [Acidimicrobiia bacterium]|nr:adenylate/guanylate cyclase domain-containing protein [Acidimicrobiia bacterium]
MSESTSVGIAIEALESSRGVLGDDVVDAAQLALRRAQTGDAHAAEQKAERKVVTVVFADLSGFTALSEVMDPEHVRDLLNACFDRLVPAIERHGGTIDKFLGDAVMALFGAPLAHENDPERALRAALEMMDELEAFNGENDTDLGLHIGVNTGLVLAGGIGGAGHRQYSVMGDVVNVASRLESVSKRGEILIGPDTHRLTTPLFEAEELEPLHLEGREEPMPVYRLTGPGTAVVRPRGIEGLASGLVGREGEMQIFADAFAGLTGGRGGVVSVVGEAGIGKSRLVAEAKHVAGSTRWVAGRALSHTSQSAYGVAVDLLRALAGIDARSSSEDTAKRLAASVDELLPDEGRAMVWPFLGHLLGLPLDDDADRVVAPFTRSSAGSIQQPLANAYAAYLTAMTSEPLVLVWEDLHWADSSSLALLEALLPITSNLPLLMVLESRPEPGPHLDLLQRIPERTERHLPVDLGPLDRDRAGDLVANLLPVEGLPARVRQALLDKAGGNPLFLEELIRTLIETGVVGVEEGRAVATAAVEQFDVQQVPDTIHGLIAARIDRLEPEPKTTLQTAAVAGRVFPRPLLEHMVATRGGIGDLEASLAALERHEFIRATNGSAELNGSEYTFAHVLTQETAYGGVLLAERKALHGTAARSVESLFPDRVDELAATLAYHYEHAEEYEPALGYLQRAGGRSLGLSAPVEAIELCRRGLALLDDLPEVPAGLELPFRLQLGLGLTMVHGWQSDEVIEAFERARELMGEVGASPQAAALFHGLWAYYFVKGEFSTAREQADQIVAAIDLSPEPGKVSVVGHNALAGTDCMTGNLASARRHGLYVQDIDCPSLIPDAGMELKIVSRVWAALATTLLGDVDEGLRLAEDAVAEARRLEHPYSLAFALNYRKDAAVLTRDVDAAAAACGELMAISDAQGFQQWLAAGAIALGWVMAHQGEAEQGVAQIEHALGMVQSLGFRLFITHYGAMHIDALRIAGQSEAALAAVEDALHAAESHEERAFMPQLHRLRGELLVEAGRQAEGEREFETAVTVGRSIGNEFQALRAAVSWARAAAGTDGAEAARRALAEVYSPLPASNRTPEFEEASRILDGR